MTDDTARLRGCLAGLLALVALWVAVAAGWRTPLAAGVVVAVWAVTESVALAGMLGA